MEILKLQPAGKDYLWCGTRLRDEYGKNRLNPFGENTGMFRTSGWSQYCSKWKI